MDSKTRVRLENEAAAERARMQAAEAATRSEMIAQEAERAAIRKREAARKTACWKERMQQTNVKMVGCVLYEPLVLHIMEFLRPKELLDFSSTCLWARQKSMALFENSFVLAKHGIWKVAKGHSWMQRCFKV